MFKKSFLIKSIIVLSIITIIIVAIVVVIKNQQEPIIQTPVTSHTIIPTQTSVTSHTIIPTQTSVTSHTIIPTQTPVTSHTIIPTQTPIPTHISEGLSPGAITGIVIGSIFGFLLLLFFLYNIIMNIEFTNKRPREEIKNIEGIKNIYCNSGIKYDNMFKNNNKFKRYHYPNAIYPFLKNTNMNSFRGVYVIYIDTCRIIEEVPSGMLYEENKIKNDRKYEEKYYLQFLTTTSYNNTLVSSQLTRQPYVLIYYSDYYKTVNIKNDIFEYFQKCLINYEQIMLDIHYNFKKPYYSFLYIKTPDEYFMADKSYNWAKINYDKFIELIYNIPTPEPIHINAKLSY